MFIISLHLPFTVKTAAIASILALSSFTLGANAFPKQGSLSVSDGNVVDTSTYNFKNDRFGTNNNLRLGASVTKQGSPPAKASKRDINERDSKGWGVYARDADPEYIHERNAYPEAYPKKQSSSPSTVEGGNNVQNKYDIKNDKFGNNNNLNMQSSTGVYGGNPVAAVSASTGKTGNGRRGIYGFSSLEAHNPNDLLHKRDAYPKVEANLPKREAYPHGGAAKGGDSKTDGGNSATNHPVLKGVKGNGQTINMQSQMSLNGGNTFGGNGGANYPLPPIPTKRWLQAHDAEISARSAELQSLIFEREAVLDGGAARGGDPHTNGGNTAINQNHAKGGKGRGNINMQNQMSQSGGDTHGGNGGANSGNGGGGGSFQFSVPMPPIPVGRRWLEERIAMPEFH